MKHIFLKKAIPAILSLFLLFLTDQLSARHIIGGVMHYSVSDAADPDYKRVFIDLILTRDCNPASGGADFDSPATLAVYKGTDQNNTLVTTIMVNPEDIVYSTLTLPPWVYQPLSHCEEQGAYHAAFDLPLLNTGENYFFVYQRCCKAINFVNIIDPENFGMTVSTTLTAEAMNANNASPVFDNISGVLACVHDSLIFQRSVATSNFADSLVYQLSSLIHGGGPSLTDPLYSSCEGAQPTPPCAPPFDTVPYKEQAFTSQNPLGTVNPINFNASTGTVFCTPHYLGSYLFGVDAVQYRNGVKLSTTHFEFAVYVVDCAVSTVSQIPDGGVQIQPNPATAIISVSVADQRWQSATYSLKDLTGRVYGNGVLSSGTANIARKGLPSGVYFLEIANNEGGLLTKKVVFE